MKTILFQLPSREKKTYNLEEHLCFWEKYMLDSGQTPLPRKEKKKEKKKKMKKTTPEGNMHRAEDHG